MTAIKSKSEFPSVFLQYHLHLTHVSFALVKVGHHLQPERVSGHGVVAVGGGPGGHGQGAIEGVVVSSAVPVDG